MVIEATDGTSTEEVTKTYRAWVHCSPTLARKPAQPTRTGTPAQIVLPRSGGRFGRQE